MKILLFGCSGFIGKELIPRLIKEKHEICIVSRKNIDQLQIKNSLSMINFLKLDATNEKNWSNEWHVQTKRTMMLKMHSMNHRPGST